MTEQQVIDQYGLLSKEHRQYIAVLVESDLIEKYGRSSEAVKYHQEQMRRLGIPVIG